MKEIVYVLVLDVINYFFLKNNFLIKYGENKILFE